MSLVLIRIFVINIYGILAELFVSIYRTDSDTISMEKLIEFLNEKQRDPRLNEILYPHYNERRVREIIATYETDVNKVKLGKHQNI